MYKALTLAVLFVGGAAQAQADAPHALQLAQAEHSGAAAAGSDNTTDTPNVDPTDPVGANHSVERPNDPPQGATGATGADTGPPRVNDDSTPRAPDPDRMPKSEVDPTDRSSPHPSNGPRGTGL